MTNSEMFKKAHKIAREMAEAVGNYAIAFKVALKKVWAEQKAREIDLDECKAKKLMLVGLNIMPTPDEQEHHVGIGFAGAMFTTDEIAFAHDVTIMSYNPDKRNNFFRFSSKIEKGRAWYEFLYYLVGKKADRYITD